MHRGFAGRGKNSSLRSASSRTMTVWHRIYVITNLVSEEAWGRDLSRADIGTSYSARTVDVVGLVVELH